MDTDEPNKQGDNAQDRSSSFTRVDRFFFNVNDPEYKVYLGLLAVIFVVA